MKKLYITALILLSTHAVAAPKQIANKLACVDTENGNRQCTYEVKGQEIGQPDSTSNLYGMSSMAYALCSSSVCNISKNDADKAKCVCNVYGTYQQPDNWRKASVGPLDYQSSQPEFHDGLLTSVTSNFSFANTSRSNKPRKQVCKSKKPLSWANCFGVRCHIISGVNSITPLAVCDCPVVKTNQFISTGPHSKSACKLPEQKIWSGATSQQGDNDMAVIKDMYQAYYPDQAINKILK